MDGYNEDRGEGGSYSFLRTSGEPVVHTPVSRHSEKPSRDGVYFHEHLGQHAWSRQCRNAARPEGYAAHAGAEPEERHRHRCDADVSGAQRFRTRADSYRHHDVSCKLRRGKPHRRVCAHTDSHLRVDAFRHRVAVPQTAHQDLRPRDSHVAFRSACRGGRRGVVFLHSDARADAALQLVCRKHYPFRRDTDVYRRRGEKTHQCLRKLHRRGKGWL